LIGLSQIGLDQQGNLIIKFKGKCCVIKRTLNIINQSEFPLI